jgi:mono/diheme cytochrome c family protein
MLGLTSLAAALLIGAAAAAGDVNDEQAKSKALFEQHCSMCHGIDRPLSKNKTREEWQITVARMRQNAAIKKIRGGIPEEDAGRIVDYLAAVRGPK